MSKLFSIYDPHGFKLFASLRCEFSHLSKHKSRHGFPDTMK